MKTNPKTIPALLRHAGASAAFALLTVTAAAQSPTPTPIPMLAATPAPTPKPLIHLVPQPLTAAQVTAFLTQLEGGTPTTPVPTIGTPPAGTAIVRLVLVISGSGTGMIYGAVQ
jgi:hypothetical protein